MAQSSTSSAVSRKCLVVDGNSLLYRAFFAVRFLSTSSGQPTNALYGFAGMLLKLIADEKPDSLIVAFDAPAKTFRHEQFQDYKATRKPAPDELKAQTGLGRDLARSLGAVVLEIPGFEADDIVGTCARGAAANGYDVLIVTGDLDELQLVGGRIRVAATGRGVSDITEYTPEAVEGRFGLRPDQFVDFKALKGDTSDNIPGVQGVGDKTASRLINQFGSVEELIARVDELPAGKVKDAIAASVEQIRLSKHLATIVCDVPLDLDFSSLPSSSRTAGEAEALFRDLEFTTLARRLPPAAGAAAPAAEAVLPGAAVQDAAALAAGAQGALDFGGAPAAAEPPVATRVVGSAEELETVLARARAEGLAAFSLDLSPKGALKGVAVGFADEGVYIRLGSGADGFSVSAPELAARLQGIPAATHDMKEACLSLAKAGMAFPECREDTMLAGFLLQPGRGSYSLDWLAGRELGQDLPHGLTGWQAAATSACFIRRLVDRLDQRIRAGQLEDVYHNIEMPLAPVLARMQQEGVRLDGGYLQQLAEQLGRDIAALEGEIYALAGMDFNIGSPRQLGQVLFEKLQLPAGKRTKTGYSTDAETLESLAPSCEIAAKTLQWREYTKLKGTYADALPRLIDPATGRVHTSFNQTGAATGRLSSSEPNLQNIPVKTELGREIRAAFTAAPGCVLLSADYSQIELRLLAHMSGDEELTRCFREGEDVHVRTACALFGVGAADVTPEMRRRAKTINFSVIYGKTDFGLSKELSISVGEAHDYIAAYFQQYPRVQEYTQEILEAARRDGYVSTLFGRKRWFAELHTRDRNVRANAERAAFNAPLQGTAADIIKIAMISLDRKLADSAARMVLQVHDELVFDVPEDAVADVAALVRREMEGACSLSVPLTVEVKAGANWRDMSSVG